MQQANVQEKANILEGRKRKPLKCGGLLCCKSVVEIQTLFQIFRWQTPSEDVGTIAWRKLNYLLRTMWATFDLFVFFLSINQQKFKPQSFGRPTDCKVCRSLIWGLSNHGYCCECKLLGERKKNWQFLMENQLANLLCTRNASMKLHGIVEEWS